MASSPTDRSIARAASVLLRMSHDEKAELDRRAHAAGLSTTDYARQSLLGLEPQRFPSRNTPQQREGLPMTG